MKCVKPERKLIRDLTREQGVKKIVDGLMSQQYQHGYRPSGFPMNDQVRENYRKEIEELHDNVGAYDWGIPPILVNLYKRGILK